MAIKKAVIAAFVLLLKAIVDAYLPQIPMPLDFLNGVVLTLLAWAGIDVVELLPGVRNLVSKMHSRKLW